jgi:hypothetical protein
VDKDYFTFLSPEVKESRSKLAGDIVGTWRYEMHIKYRGKKMSGRSKVGNRH